MILYRHYDDIIYCVLSVTFYSDGRAKKSENLHFSAYLQSNGVANSLYTTDPI